MKLCFLLSVLLWGSSGSLWAAEPFLWGVANSAFQTEGSPEPSDWKDWKGVKAETAFGFYRNYEREFGLARDLGANAFRISLAWERIEPEPGRFNERALAHYESMIVAMKKRGLTPVVTLHHFVNPKWLEGGILNPNFPERFSKFAQKVVERLGSGSASVRWWVTINEPEVLAKGAYLDADWPPGKSDLQLTLEAMAQLTRAHLRSVNAIRSLPGAKDFRIGFSKHWRPFEAETLSPLDWIAARLTDDFFNRQIMDGFLDGKIRYWAPGGKKVREDFRIEGNARGADFVGVNYYGRSKVRFSTRSPYVIVSEGPGPKSDIGWEIYPEGLAQTLRDVASYRLPILVTENGVADGEDRHRSAFLREHIAAMDRVRSEGVSILGYLHWTLTDNLEWSRGFGPKFGLCPSSSKGRADRCRPSFREYQSLIRSHSKDRQDLGNGVSGL